MIGKKLPSECQNLALIGFPADWRKKLCLCEKKSSLQNGQNAYFMKKSVYVT